MQPRIHRLALPLLCATIGCSALLGYDGVSFEDSPADGGKLDAGLDASGDARSDHANGGAAGKADAQAGGTGATDAQAGASTGGAGGAGAGGTQTGGTGPGGAGSGGAPPQCPDTTCDPGESCASCPQDCGPCCPNTACDNGETCTTCPQDCGACPPPLEARFNLPTGDKGYDHTLEDTIIDLVNHTPAGQIIRLSLYNFTRVPPAEALVAAQTRGVDVRVILDANNEGPDTAAVTTLKAGLPADHITICHSVMANSQPGGSCIGTDINHSKFFLFSALDNGLSNIVVQSSANLTWPQMAEFNNMVIVRGDNALYQGYLGYWGDQHAQVKNPDYYKTVVGDLAVRSYFFPRATGDTIVSVLDNVVCTGNKHLRIAMAFFTDSRLPVAQKLAQKAGQGCTIEAILRAPPDTGSSVLSTLKNGGVIVTQISESATQSTVHSKYLLVDSSYDTGTGPEARKLVFTGSHNYTNGALRENDEQLMRVDDPGIYAAFEANWQQIRATLP